MDIFLFFQLPFRLAYDSADDSDFRFSLDHKVSYGSDSDSVASENQPSEKEKNEFRGVKRYHSQAVIQVNS